MIRVAGFAGLDVALKGNEGPEMVCERCQRHFWPRVGSYWFLLLAPRGRSRFPGVTAAESVLCGPCGRLLREYIECEAFARGGAYERRRKGHRAGGPARDLSANDGAEGYGQLVADALANKAAGVPAVPG